MKQNSCVEVYVYFCKEYVFLFYTLVRLCVVVYGCHTIKTTMLLTADATDICRLFTSLVSNVKSL